MGIGKRTVYVSKEELEELLGLPEGAEILAVRPNSAPNQGWEFLVVSAGEIEGLTVVDNGEVNLRKKMSIQSLAKWKETRSGE